MTENQKIVEGWAYALIVGPSSLNPTDAQVDELNKFLHMARLGAWYDKHRVMLENILHTAITEMESTGHVSFHKAIEQCRTISQEMPREN